MNNMYSVSLLDDWDRTVGMWRVGTKKEAEELKEYIDKKVIDMGFEYKFSSCDIEEVEDGDKEIIDDFFEDIKKEFEEERNENYISPLAEVVDKVDITYMDFSAMFKECK